MNRVYKEKDDQILMSAGSLVAETMNAMNTYRDPASRAHKDAR